MHQTMRGACFPELGGSTVLVKNCATGWREGRCFRCVGKVSPLPDAELAPLRGRECPSSLEAGSLVQPRAAVEFKTVTDLTQACSVWEGASPLTAASLAPYCEQATRLELF